jgi:cation:H+ antiporter
MWLFSIALLAGVLLLAKGAHYFIRHAAQLAKHWGLSSLWIGIFVLGFATSAPELLVATLASLQQKQGLAVGSIIGSNIANIGLVLGVSACFIPIQVPHRVIYKELTILMVVTLAVSLMCLGLHLGRWHALALLVMLVSALWLLSRGQTTNTEQNLDQIPLPSARLYGIAVRRTLMLCAVGLVLLLMGAESLVWGAIHIAQHVGINDVVIGLSMVAIGTSLPELATSLTSTFKGENDFILGNIIGSNLFNLLAVLAVPILIHPITLPATLIQRDMPCLLLATAALYMASRSWQRRAPCIHRWEGALLILGYIGYIVWVYQSA